VTARAKKPSKSKSRPPRKADAKQRADLFFYERLAFDQGARVLAGIDEVGRGPLAGAVVAAAVILPRDFTHPFLTDSKLLTPEQRECIYAELTSRPEVAWSIGIVDHQEIDRVNILVATYLAMRAAVDNLRPAADFLLIDGRPVPVFSRMRQIAIVQGDQKSYSIAAASVIAKVTRDRLMVQMHERYPQYDFKSHKGYSTPEHLQALAQFGPCPIHRRSFFPVRQEPVEENLFEL